MYFWALYLVFLTMEKFEILWWKYIGKAQAKHNLEILRTDNKGEGELKAGCLHSKAFTLVYFFDC